jgi:hypothetical protein
MNEKISQLTPHTPNAADVIPVEDGDVNFTDTVSGIVNLAAVAAAALYLPLAGGTLSGTLTIGSVANAPVLTGSAFQLIINQALYAVVVGVGNGAGGYWSQNVLAIPVGSHLDWSASSNASASTDTSISRVSPNVIQIGNTSGTPDASGTLNLAAIHVAGGTTGSATGSGIFGNSSFASTANVDGNLTNGVNIQDATGNLIQSGLAGTIPCILLYTPSTGAIFMDDGAGDGVSIWNGTVGFEDAAHDLFTLNAGTILFQVDNAHNKAKFQMSGTGSFDLYGNGTSVLGFDNTSGSRYGSLDTFISRGAPGTVCIGAGATAGDASGTLNAATLIENATLTPASATTAGVTGQIAWQGTNGTTGQIFICTSGGSAGGAIWMAATLVKV